MKRFFYLHPLFSIVCIFVLCFLPIFTGFLLTGILQSIESPPSHAGLLCFLFVVGGMLLSLMLALLLILVPTLRALDVALDELWQLKRGRKVFYAPTPHTDTEHAVSAICENAKNRKMEETESDVSDPVSPVKIFRREVSFYKNGITVFSIPTYYLLYRAETVDLRTYEAICESLKKQTVRLLAGKQSPYAIRPFAFAACVLCDYADAEVTDRLQAITKLETANVHLGLGIVPQNKWYLPACRIDGDESSSLARTELGKVTFGMRGRVFPTRNTAYTDAFYQKVEQICENGLRATYPNTPSAAQLLGIVRGNLFQSTPKK